MARYFNQNDLFSEKGRLLERIQGYSELGMYKEAVAESKKLVKIDWADPSSFFELAYSYEENGEIKKAIRCYKNYKRPSV